MSEGIWVPCQGALCFRPRRPRFCRFGHVRWCARLCVEGASGHRPDSWHPHGDGKPHLYLPESPFGLALFFLGDAAPASPNRCFCRRRMAAACRHPYPKNEVWITGIPYSYIVVLIPLGLILE